MVRPCGGDKQILFSQADVSRVLQEDQSYGGFRSLLISISSSDLTLLVESHQPIYLLYHSKTLSFPSAVFRQSSSKGVVKEESHVFDLYHDHTRLGTI